MFTYGLHSECLKLVCQGIITNEKTNYDFQEAYAFTQTMEQFNTAGLAKGEASFIHEISQVESGKGKGEVDTYHKMSEWFALPEDERKKILAAQDKNGGCLKNGWKKHGGGARAVGAATWMD
jgi:hypothetical protein